MRRIDTSIDIAASPAVVWSLLADIAAYPEWNPFIIRLEGEVRVGAGLTVTAQPPGGKPMSFQPTVLTVEPGRELRWRGKVLMPGIFDGEHSFTLEPIAAGCRFHHNETFGGILVPLFRTMLDSTARGFVEMNEALKRRAEARG